MQTRQLCRTDHCQMPWQPQTSPPPEQMEAVEKGTSGGLGFHPWHPHPLCFTTLSSPPLRVAHAAFASHSDRKEGKSPFARSPLSMRLSVSSLKLSPRAGARLARSMVIESGMCVATNRVARFPARLAAPLGRLSERRLATKRVAGRS